MADTLLLQFSPAQPEHATWAQVNAQGELTAKISQGPLSEASELASESSKIVVLLDSSCLHFNKVSLPTQNRQKMLRAVPYALEEQIAEDVDDFHFAIGKPDANANIPVVGINKTILDDLLTTLADVNIHPDFIIPDTLCLTANDKQWALLFDEDRVYVQYDKLNGNLFDRDMLQVLLGSTFKQDPDHLPEKIIIFTQENDAVDGLSDLIPDDIEIIYVHYNTHPIVVFCGQYKNALPLNLLRDAYKPRRKGNIQWQRWTLAASLAAIWLGLHLSVTAFQYYDLKGENEKISALVTNIYKKTFPNSRKIVNARVQMEQKLNELKGNKQGGSSSMMKLLSDSAKALSGEKNITIESINYRNNKMNIGLVGTNLQAIETLNKSLNNNARLKSEITSSSSEKKRVKGNIRLQKSET